MANRYFTYKVQPHSDPKWAERAAKFSGDESPCAICGRGVKDADHPYWGIVTDGGGRWGESWDDGGSGNMGAFPVGKDCHRRHVDKEVFPK